VLKKLNRRTALTAIGGGLAMPFVRPSWAQAGTVNIYNWADYIGETTIADFEAATGISVVYDTYSSTEEMEAKMLAGFTGYDVAFQSGISLPRFITAGVYMPLDRARLLGFDAHDPRLIAMLENWDPGVQHGVPYMWGSVGFTFNMDMVNARMPDADLSDLSFLFDPAKAALLADCGISLLDSPTDLIPLGLAYLGIDPQTTDVSQYDKVVELFAPIREHIRTFDNNNYLNAIPNGELCVINTYSGDYAVAAGRAAEAGIAMDLAYVVPKTGAPVWFDVMSVPVDAPNPDNAYAFLDFMLKPDVIAGCTNYTYYANANLASKPFVDPAILADPAVYPPEDVISRLWAPKTLNEDQDRAITRAWQTIKTG
jgi:putrescine transport system substrate-binding protein